MKSENAKQLFFTQDWSQKFFKHEGSGLQREIHLYTHHAEPESKET